MTPVVWFTTTSHSDSDMCCLKLSKYNNQFRGGLIRREGGNFLSQNWGKICKIGIYTNFWAWKRKGVNYWKDFRISPPKLVPWIHRAFQNFPFIHSRKQMQKKRSKSVRRLHITDARLAWNSFTPNLTRQSTDMTKLLPFPRNRLKCKWRIRKFQLKLIKTFK